MGQGESLRVRWSYLDKERRTLRESSWIWMLPVVFVRRVQIALILNIDATMPC